jgi:uncharacterized protein DUF6527
MPESKQGAQGKYLGVSAGDGEGLEDVAYESGIGSYYWNEDKSILFIMIPAEIKGGCCLSAWHIRPNQNDGGHSWEWDGNVEKPTLTPSLHAVGIWHGWMRNGNLVSA